MSNVKLFGREPTLWIALITSAIMFVGTLQFGWLSGDQAGLMIAAINAVAGAINAYTVRPIAPAAFTYAVAAIVAVGVSYGLEVTPEQVAAINGFVIVVLGLLTRTQVAPVATLLSRESTALRKPEVDAT